MDRVDVRPAVLPVEHETRSSATRTTIDNRTLTYRMTVLQQPARARACGQGAKSSADRRPVDPPPIVELKIFDGETDITFQMQANYFLYAELEQARPMAHGRVSGEKQIPPVLTGTPVAGMVYLDRPSPAGYFIFPDLSVRHEGKYRLSFGLYEDLKNSKDEDKPLPGSESSPPGSSHVTHRLDVRSEPFMVYSAKKFPGLNESTSLSRMVAEQGCRVRIRRDVRMRRRDTKGGGKEWDDYEDDTAQARANMSATPDPNAYNGLPATHGYVDPMPRPRSASNASLHSLASNISRRPSVQDMNPAYGHHFASPAPHISQNGYPQTSTYNTMPNSQYQPTFIQQQATMQPPPPQYQPHSYAQSQPAPLAAQPAYYGGYSSAPAQQSQYAPLQPSYEHASQPLHSIDYQSQVAPADPRRNTLPQSGPAPVSNSLSYPQSSYTSYQPSAAPRPMPLEPRANSATTPISNRPNYELPPLNTAITPSTRIEASSPASAVPYPNAFKTSMGESNKRNYSSVFNDKYQDQPMRQGARPGSHTRASDGPLSGAAPSLSAVADDDDAPHLDLGLDSLGGMKYRRADGRQIMRSLPSRA